MVWRAEDPQGNESAKVRHELLPYLRGRCLDIGCGTEKVWPHFIGVDNFIDVRLFGIPVKADIRIDSADRLDLFTDGQFDCVFSSHLLEHMQDYKAALREWWRLVKLGGTLILYLPHKDHYPNIGQPGANPDHKHDFLPLDITAAMAVECRGFDLEVNETRSGGIEYSFLQVYRKHDDLECFYSWALPKPEKTAAVVRLGAYGDALWCSSLLPHLKEDGYHVTVYTQERGEIILRSDPHIDRIIVVPSFLYDGAGLIGFLLYEEKKYDRFINLIGTVETLLLPQASDEQFWKPQEQRRRMYGRNYLEAIHDAAGIKRDFRQKFYPTPDETAWAKAERAKYSGPVVVLNPAGSTPPKWWPHAQRLMELLAANAIHLVVVGDTRGQLLKPVDGFGECIGNAWPIRKAMAFAMEADVVVGTESAIVNAVAFEPVLKIVLLSHSTQENLTKHWLNTFSVEPRNVDCYPCHRIHQTWTYCVQIGEHKAAACQAIVDPHYLATFIGEYLQSNSEQAA